MKDIHNNGRFKERYKWGGSLKKFKEDKNISKVKNCTKADFEYIIGRCISLIK